MKIKKTIYTVLWFLIAISWIIFVAHNRENEGWEWYFRLPIGVSILFVGIITVFFSGGDDERGVIRKIKEPSVLFMIGLVDMYLLARFIAALRSGDISSSFVFGIFFFGVSNAFVYYWNSSIGTRKKIETIATWCFQEFTNKSPWVMKRNQPGLFEGYTPKRFVTENDVYGKKINKALIRRISDKALLELPGIGEKELAIINLFLFVPRLPGISMDVARQIHKDGLYSPSELKNLSLDEWQKYKGIGPKKSKDIMEYLGRAEDGNLSPGQLQTPDFSRPRK